MKEGIITIIFLKFKNFFQEGNIIRHGSKAKIIKVFLNSFLAAPERFLLLFNHTVSMK
jgi:hypothetical protein